jgi:hypothetical protein
MSSLLLSSRTLAPDLTELHAADYEYWHSSATESKEESFTARPNIFRPPLPTRSGGQSYVEDASRYFICQANLLQEDDDDDEEDRPHSSASQAYYNAAAPGHVQALQPSDRCLNLQFYAADDNGRTAPLVVDFPFKSAAATTAFSSCTTPPPTKYHARQLVQSPAAPRLGERLIVLDFDALTIPSRNRETLPYLPRLSGLSRPSVQKAERVMTPSTLLSPRLIHRAQRLEDYLVTASTPTTTDENHDTVNIIVSPTPVEASKKRKPPAGRQVEEERPPLWIKQNKSRSSSSPTNLSTSSSIWQTQSVAVDAKMVLAFLEKLVPKGGALTPMHSKVSISSYHQTRASSCRASAVTAGAGQHSMCRSIYC